MTRARKRALARDAALAIVAAGSCISAWGAITAYQSGQLSAGWAIAYVAEVALSGFAVGLLWHVIRLADWQIAYWRDAYVGAEGLYRTAAGLLAERRSLAADVARAVAEGLTIEERAQLVAEAMRAETPKEDA